MDNTNTPATVPDLQIPPEILTYLEGILQDANLAQVDDSVHQQMIIELYARFDSFLTAKIIENMPEENVEEFITMNEENRPQEEIQKFMMEKIPNAEEVFANFFIEFRERYLGNIMLARQAENLQIKHLQTQKLLRMLIHNFYGKRFRWRCTSPSSP